MLSIQRLPEQATLRSAAVLRVYLVTRAGHEAVVSYSGGSVNREGCG